MSGPVNVNATSKLLRVNRKSGTSVPTISPKLSSTLLCLDLEQPVSFSAPRPGILGHFHGAMFFVFLCLKCFRAGFSPGCPGSQNCCRCFLMAPSLHLLADSHYIPKRLAVWYGLLSAYDRPYVTSTL